MIKKYGFMPFIVLIGLIFAVSILYANKIEIFPSFCGDGQSKAILGARWIKSPMFMDPCSPLWLPLPNWLIGIGLKIFYDLYWVPIAINLIFSAVSLFLLYEISWVFFKNRIIGLISIALTAFLRDFVGLAISGMSEPVSHFFIIATFLFYFKWIMDKDKTRFLLISGMMMALGNMTRMNNWSFSFLFTISTLIIALRNKPVLGKNRIKILSFLIIPWIFPLIWESMLHIKVGTFLAYYNDCKKCTDSWGWNLNTSKLFLFFLKHIFIVAPFIFITSAIQACRAFRKRENSYLLYFGIAILYNIPILALFLKGAIPSSPERLFIISFMLLSPFSARLIYDIFAVNKFKPFFRYSLKIFVFMIFVLIVFKDISASCKVPFWKEGNAIARIGCRLKTMWESGILKDDDIVVIRPKDGDEVTSFVMAAAYSNHPFNIRVVRKETDSSAMERLVSASKVLVLSSKFYQEYKGGKRQLFKIKDYHVLFSYGKNNR